MKFKIKYSLFLLFTIFAFVNKTFAAIENAKFPIIVTNGQGQYVYDLWIKNNSGNDIIQVASSSDYGASWNTPINLSGLGQDAKTPCFANDSTEKNIFAIWLRSNGTNDVVQFSSSLDFAQSWTNPIDLSAAGQNASNPCITTHFVGEHVYAVWQRSNGSNDIIQFSKSSDFGQSFSTPIDLSAAGQNASMARVATDINQNCVCAIWKRSNGVNDIIQFKHSSDYGMNWSSTLDLSMSGENATNPALATTGNYIYTIWTRQDNGVFKTQFRKSTDNGATFSDVIDISPDAFSINNPPKMVISNDAKYIYVSWCAFNGMFTDVHVVFSTDFGDFFSSPHVLNKYGGNCKDVDITTDSSGKNIYVVWARSNGFNDIIQIGKSQDYGSTWTTFGVDLSQVGQDAKNPRVTTNKSGKEVYVSWSRFDGTKDVIQEVYSNDYGATFSVPKTISN